jgi:phage portal protein BeeE
VLDPSVVEVKLVDGRKAFQVNDTVVDARDVVQITRDPGAALRGTSALRAYSAQAWSQIGAGTTSQNIQGGGTVPPVTLMSKRKLTADQARAVQDAWVAARSRYGSGVPAVLSSADFDKPEALNINPKDLALLDLAEYDARVIASAFGVPSFMLNLPLSGALVYQNPAMLGEFWWRFELRPTAKRIADALTAQMLPRGQFVTFDAADTILPVDDGSDEDLGLLASRLGLAVQYGIMSPDEARVKLVEAGLVLDPTPSGPISQVAKASPNDQKVTPLRPAQGGN